MRVMAAQHDSDGVQVSGQIGYTTVMTTCSSRLRNQWKTEYATRLEGGKTVQLRWRGRRRHQR